MVLAQDGCRELAPGQVTPFGDPGELAGCEVIRAGSVTVVLLGDGRALLWVNAWKRGRTRRNGCICQTYAL